VIEFSGNAQSPSVIPLGGFVVADAAFDFGDVVKGTGDIFHRV
jgi:hypothetical protein